MQTAHGNPLDAIERDMSATPAEFARGLDHAFGDRVTGGPHLYQVAGGDAAMEIEVKVGPPRVIALLSLPTLRVRIRFTAGSASERTALLERMDRSMHRGGG